MIERKLEPRNTSPFIQCSTWFNAMLHNMIPKKSKYCKKLQNNKSRRKNFLHLFKLQSSTHRLWRWWRYPWSAFYDDSSFLNMRHCDIMSIHACMKRFKIFDEIHFSGFPCSSMQRTSRQTSKRQDLLWPSSNCRWAENLLRSSKFAEKCLLSKAKLVTSCCRCSFQKKDTAAKNEDNLALVEMKYWDETSRPQLNCKIGKNHLTTLFICWEVEIKRFINQKKG